MIVDIRAVLLAALISGILMLTFCETFCRPVYIDDVRKDAIKHHVGEFYINSYTHKKDFRWIEPIEKDTSI